jgi:hypothetical protein
LHNETNDNGMKMIQFAVSKCLNVWSTTYMIVERKNKLKQK